jgi:hypothetical protein
MHGQRSGYSAHGDGRHGTLVLSHRLLWRSQLPVSDTFVIHCSAGPCGKSAFVGPIHASEHITRASSLVSFKCKGSFSEVQQSSKLMGTTVSTHGGHIYVRRCTCILPFLLTQDVYSDEAHICLCWYCSCSRSRMSARFTESVDFYTVVLCPSPVRYRYRCDLSHPLDPCAHPSVYQSSSRPSPARTRTGRSSSRTHTRRRSTCRWPRRS